MRGLLDRYVAKCFLSSWLVSAVFFVGLYGVYDFFAHVDDLMEQFDAADVGPGAVGQLYLYQTPDVMLQVAPFIMVMAALVCVMRLQRSNEFMAMVLTGRSPRRVLRPVFVLSGVFVLGFVFLQEVVAPNVALERDRLQARLLEGETEWVIPEVTLNDAEGKLFVIRDFHVNEATIALLSVTYEDRAGRNVHITGTNATWDETGRGWRLEEGTSEVRRLDSDESPLRQSAPFVRTDLRPNDLLVESSKPFDLGYGDVLDLSRRYPASRRYRLLRHYHVTYPLTILLMVLLVMPFVVRPSPAARLKGLGIAILLCMGFKLADAAIQDLGSQGHLQPVLAAWLPVIVAGSLATVLFEGLDR